MKDTELSRVISQFKAVYAKEVSNGKNELRLSQLLPADQAEYRRREAELHPSSFPFCGLRYAYELANLEDDPVIAQNFGSDYFLNAGTVFHSAVQNWVGRGGDIIGTWKCLACKHETKPRTWLPKCPKCDSVHLEYQELGGKWGKHVSWHSDGVFKQPTKKLWVIDYKTTSNAAIMEHRKTKQVFPYTKNRFQIETYAPLIEDTYGVKVEGWLLVYCARDNPSRPWNVEVVGGVIDNERREVLKERLHQADKDWGIARRVTEKPIAVYKRLQETKICPDRDFYNDNIYDKYDPCPLAKVCFSKTKLQAFLEK